MYDYRHSSFNNHSHLELVLLSGESPFLAALPSVLSFLSREEEYFLPIKDSVPSSLSISPLLSWPLHLESPHSLSLMGGQISLLRGMGWRWVRSGFKAAYHSKAEGRGLHDSHSHPSAAAAAAYLTPPDAPSFSLHLPTSLLPGLDLRLEAA